MVSKMSRQNSGKDQPTYEGVVLGLLAYEFFSADRAEIDRKIKRHLREKKLGLFEPDWIQILRALKAEVQEEIGKFDRSAYFTGRHGRYASMRDFDTGRLCDDLGKKYPQVPQPDIAGFIGFAVYLYYLR